MAVGYNQQGWSRIIEKTATRREEHILQWQAANRYVKKFGLNEANRSNEFIFTTLLFSLSRDVLIWSRIYG